MKDLSKKVKRGPGSKILSYGVYAMNFIPNPIGAVVGLGTRLAEDTDLVKESNSWLNLARGVSSAIFTVYALKSIYYLFGLESQEMRYLPELLVHGGANALLSWRFLADTPYLKNRKQLYEDVKKVFKFGDEESSRNKDSKIGN